MSMKLYKMTFDHAHFGEGQLNESQSSFDAARLYSALFLEAKKIGRADDFLSLSKESSFVLSDAFPYINGQPYLPKPIGYPKQKENSAENLKQLRQEAKKVKKIQYIPLEQFADFLNRKADVGLLANQQKKLASHDFATKKGIDPFEVGMTAFKSALYVLADQSALFDLLMESLQYSGLGGKRTSGYGQFNLEILAVPQLLQQHLNKSDANIYMSLTTSLPTEIELEESMHDAYYIIKKASGFAYSEEAGELLRKQDMYKFKAGSTFKRMYKGSIIDVRPDDFPHPVWHFSKGLFYQLS